MVSETRKASNAPRKRHPTTKARENNEKTSKPPAKRVKSKGFVHPNKMSKEPTPESRSSTPEVIEQSLDVSDLQYTVIWVCMLGSVSVGGDTDLYKLSEFNYREFNHLMVKKVTRAIEKSKIDFEWKSGSAALTFKGMSKANAIPIEVQDEEGWKKVEKLVEKAMRDKKHEITVRLTVNYEKKARVDGEDLDDEDAELGGGKMVYILH
jgi:hypothetical protein